MNELKMREVLIQKINQLKPLVVEVVVTQRGEHKLHLLSWCAVVDIPQVNLLCMHDLNKLANEEIP